MDIEQLIKINEKFNNDICVLQFDIKLFPNMVKKCHEIWQQIDTKGEDKLEWIICQSISPIQTIKGVKEKIIVYLFGEADYETIRKVIEGEEIDG